MPFGDKPLAVASPGLMPHHVIRIHKTTLFVWRGSWNSENLDHHSPYGHVWDAPPFETLASHVLGCRFPIRLCIIQFPTKCRTTYHQLFHLDGYNHPYLVALNIVFAAFALSTSLCCSATILQWLTQEFLPI